MCFCNSTDGIGECIRLLLGHLAGFNSFLTLDIRCNAITNSVLGSSLTNFCNIGTRKSFGGFCELFKTYVISNRRLSEIGLENRNSGFKIWEWNVNKLIQTTGTHDTGIENIGTVCGSNDEKSFSRSHTIDFGQNLVDNTVTGIRTSGATRTTRSGNRIHLIKEQDTRTCSTGLVEQVSHIGFGSTEPSIQKLGSLHTDKVSTAFVSNCLRHQGLTATGRTVKQDTTRGLHTKSLEQMTVFNRVSDHFLQFAFRLFQTTDIRPLGIGNLDLVIP
mmetsp:Transcript_5314/g.15436  ORF Transcript_5314/g.15436 Transcript_5314/m.15436 type:complete len:274 (+) Transcript_5314:359-1180(+)